ncbi:uncharacterized protein LOC143645903 [Tamandua tetradactyla]|uniref:uncharacterized protein LOC143645903 n=1 Tax=Tamandua tetradactyla TaxID=48850 RepID=UPI0040546E00
MPPRELHETGSQEKKILPGNTVQHRTKIVYISTTLNNRIEIPVSCLSNIQVTLTEEVQRKENFLKTAFNLEPKQNEKDARLGNRVGGDIYFSRWLRNLNMYHWIIPLLIK